MKSYQDRSREDLLGLLDGYQMALEVFLGAPLRREEFHERFADLEAETRKHNGHAAMIEVLRDVRLRLVP